MFSTARSFPHFGSANNAIYTSPEYSDFIGRSPHNSLYIVLEYPFIKNFTFQQEMAELKRLFVHFVKYVYVLHITTL